MIIEGLSLRNFRSHRNTDIRFAEDNEKPGITVIVGDNGAGKTSLLDAIGFALFKAKPEGVGMDELIALGAAEAEVQLTFRSNGRRYRVRRLRSLKKGAESYFYRLEGDLESLIAKTEREVTGEVEKTIGVNGELFASAVHVRQGEIDRLLSGDAATRKRHIGKLIGAEDMENTHKNFLEVIKEYDLKLRELSMIPQELEEKKAAVAREKTAVKAFISELSGVEKDIQKERKRVEEIEKRIDGLDRVIRRVEEGEKHSIELSHLKEKIEKISGYEGELKETEEKAKEADLVEKEREKVKSGLREYDGLKHRTALAEKEIESERKRAAALKSDLEKTFSEGASLLGTAITGLEHLAKEKEAALKELEKEIEKTGKEREKVQKILAEKKASLGALKKALSELGGAVGSCPVCGRELTEKHKEELRAGYSAEAESLEKTIEATAKEFKELKSEAGGLEERKVSLSHINVEAAKERKRWLDEGEMRISTLEERLKKDKSALTGLPPLMEKLQGLEGRFASLKPMKERYIAALGFLRKNLSEKEDLLSKASELGKRISEIKREASGTAEKLGTDLDSLRSDLAVTKENHRGALTSLTELKEKNAAFGSSVKEKERWISELSEEISQKEILEKKRKSLLEFKRLLEKIRAVFHKDVLQRQLRLKAKPLIEEYTRDVFLNFNLPYSDVTLTEDFSLRVHGEAGDASIDMLSGGERIAAALALRIGLSRALSGPVMELLILDEPTIHLDSQRRRELVDVIKRLATIPQTIVVTHDKEFEESADRIIEVEKIDGVSVVR